MLTKFLRAAAGQAPSAATDPNFNQTVLLLHGDGTNGGQNNTFIDGSANNFTITRNGNTTQGSVTPYGNLWSNSFDGTGDYLSVSPTTGLSGNLFTIECFVYLTKIPEPSSGFRVASILTTTSTASGSGGNFGFQFGIDSSASNYTGLRIYANNGTLNYTATTTIPLNTWLHIAITRNTGGVFTLYLNGTSVGTTTNTTTWTDNLPWGIGRNNQGGFEFYLPGYISNLRVVNGSVVYTGNFTPPTAPLTAITNTSLLTCQSNRFIDNSSNNFTITRNGDVGVTSFVPFNPTAEYSASTDGASGYFDGNGDFLQTPTSSALAANSTNYTVEAWVYVDLSTYSVFDNSRGIVSDYGTNSNGRWLLSINSSGFLSFAEQNASGAGGVTIVDSAAFPLRAWTHVMAVKSGTTMYLFKNGVLVSSGTSASRTGFVGRLNVGQLTVDTGFRGYFIGYISNVRFLNGTALYTSSFTPPTAPLTAITNTALLLNFANAAIFDNTQKNNLETVGNAQIDTTVKKYGTGSIEFDGTGDWLTIPNNINLQLQSANFTIEFWVYLASGDTGSNRGLIAKGGASTGWLVSLDATQKVVFTFTTSTITSSGAITTDAWNHIAVVREGTGTNLTKIYINGTNDGTGTVSTNFNQTEIMYVGANRTGATPMKGYMDDIRISNGVARYTANFTPPTQAFPNL